jgi:formate hydrogenlyase subunit 6/NADH:ubiquinone oxidoreductase subunit I/coenzyme F420-reducing hydrogenase delta subunit
MPSISDIVELVQALETKPVLIMADKCVAVRNRNATCRRCVEACPVSGAVGVGNNILDLDFGACTACGACTTVCPTEALMPLEPMDTDLADQVASACLAQGDGQAVIACARISSKHNADPRTFAEVPCLGRVEESLLIGLASHGVESIILVDGDCPTCKFRTACTTIDAVVRSANDLLGTWGSEALVRRASAFPPACALEDERGSYGQARRGFFAKAKQGAKDTAVKAAVHELELEKEQPSLRDRLKVGDGKMPQFEAVRRMNILNGLDSLGTPSRAAIETRLWGRVEIDAQVCNACGMCAVFCPTGALSKVGEDAPAKPNSGIVFEFSCAECVQCGLCADACFRKCLNVSSSVQTSELLDFEPRRIDVSGEAATASGFLG